MKLKTILVLFTVVNGLLYYCNSAIEKPKEVKKEVKVDNTKVLYQMKVISLMKSKNTNMEQQEMLDLASIIYNESKSRGIDPYLPIALIYIECNFKKGKVGKDQDSGLYQFLPSTAKWVCQLNGIKYYKGIEHNIKDSTKLWFLYNEYLYKKFNGDINKVLLAYNCGEGNVKKYTVMRIKNTIYKGKVSYDDKVLVIFNKIRVIKINYLDITLLNSREIKNDNKFI